MKKVIAVSVLIVIIINMMPMVGASRTLEDLYKKEMRNSVRELEKCDIVRNPFERWSEDDYITRRDVLKILYIARRGTREMPGYWGEHDDDDAKSIEKWKEGLREIIRVDFVDIGYGTFDYYFFYAVTRMTVNYDMLQGRDTDEGPVIDFDSYATYGEALTFIGRLFEDVSLYRGFDPRPQNKLVDYDQEYPYYDFACRIGLINSTSPIDFGSPRITEDQLDEYIPAYEYMHLVRRLLYIPHIQLADFSDELNKYWIDSFVEYIGNISRPGAIEGITD